MKLINRQIREILTADAAALLPLLPEKHIPMIGAPERAMMALLVWPAEARAHLNGDFLSVALVREAAHDAYEKALAVLGRAGIVKTTKFSWLAPLVFARIYYSAYGHPVMPRGQMLGYCGCMLPLSATINVFPASEAMCKTHGETYVLRYNLDDGAR